MVRAKCNHFFDLSWLCIQDNILVDSTGQPKLTDFGTSRLLRYTKSALKTTTGRESNGGTVRWMAYDLLCLPEPAASQEEESSSDDGSSEYEINSRGSDGEGSSSIRNADDVFFSETVQDKGMTPSAEGSDEDIIPIMSGNEDDNDEEGIFARHTKMSEMWAFVMVVYVSLPLLVFTVC